MIFESIFRTTWGTFQSAGSMETDAATIVEFFSKADRGEGPRLQLREVTRSGELVRVTREIRSTRVEVERNDCLFDTIKEAEAFEAQLRAIKEANCEPSELDGMEDFPIG